MVRKIALVVALLITGVAIAVYVRGGFGSAAVDDSFEPQTNASADVRIADLEKALAAQIDRARTLERRVSELEGRLGGEGGNVARRGELSEEQRAARAAEMRERFGDEGNFDPATIGQRQRERRLQSLVAAGFTRERAEWIERRTEELQVQAMQAQYDAQRNGRPGQGQFDIERTLRSEMGDAEYERYLTATGRPTQVQVFDVLASSSAERAGLLAGDEIVSYGGTRVFDMRDLEALAREGTAGETVSVEVRRSGQTVTVQVPRGPLGVSGGGRIRGGPGGMPPGGPARQGGFRGN
jgi:hypothetical protein